MACLFFKDCRLFKDGSCISEEAKCEIAIALKEVYAEFYKKLEKITDIRNKFSYIDFLGRDL